MGFPRQEYWSGLPFPSQPRECHVFCIGRRIAYRWATREAHMSDIHTLNCLLWTNKGILGHAIQLSYPDTIQIVHRHTCVYTCILLCVHTYMCVHFVYMYFVYACTHMCVHVCFVCVHAHTCVYMCVLCIYVHTHMHVCVRTSCSCTEQKKQPRMNCVSCFQNRR